MFGTAGAYVGPGDQQDQTSIWNYPQLQKKSYQLGPWSTKWFGQLGRNAYFNTFKVPFQKSIRLTYMSGADDQGKVQPDCMLFIQARGVSGLTPTGLTEVIPGFTLPATARLQLQVRNNVTYKPLDYMVVADVPTGNGAVFARLDRLPVWLFSF